MLETEDLMPRKPIPRVTVEPGRGAVAVVMPVGEARSVAAVLLLLTGMKRLGRRIWNAADAAEGTARR